MDSVSPDRIHETLTRIHLAQFLILNALESNLLDELVPAAHIVNDSLETLDRGSISLHLGDLAIEDESVDLESVLFSPEVKDGYS